MEEIKVTIINRSRFAREGIERWLNSRGEVRVVSHHSTVERAFRAIEYKNPSVVVIDYPDCNEYRSIIALTELRSDLAVVVSGVALTIDCIVPCVKAGASAYIRCEASGEDWAAAIIGAVNGEITDPEIAGLLNRYIASAHSGKGLGVSKKPVDETWRVPETIEKSAERVGLTRRERQILSLIDKGLSTKHIARKLKMQPNTVKTHVSAILGKYNVHRRGEAAALFRQSEQSDATDNNKAFAINI